MTTLRQVIKIDDRNKSGEQHLMTGEECCLLMLQDISKVFLDIEETSLNKEDGKERLRQLARELIK